MEFTFFFFLVSNIHLAIYQFVIRQNVKDNKVFYIIELAVGFIETLWFAWIDNLLTETLNRYLKRDLSIHYLTSIF